MLSRLRARLTYANVVATMAIFLALGGASYAAVTLPKSSVGVKQLKTNSVNSRKVRNHTLLARDFKAGQLRPGPAGPQGPKGDPGADGAAGAAATKLYAVVDLDGNIVESSGVPAGQGQVKLSGQGAGKGEYQLSFDRDVTHCARIATVGGNELGALEGPGEVGTALTGTSRVRVLTGSSDGSTEQPQAFTLVVFC